MNDTNGRRRFLRSAAMATGALAAPSLLRAQTSSTPDDTGVSLPSSNAAGTASSSVDLLSGSTHPKFVNALPNPLDLANRYRPTGLSGLLPHYQLRLREFSTRIGLVSPSGAPLSTTLWGYATPLQTTPASPGRSFVVAAGLPIRVSYVNELIGTDGAALPHRLGVDTSLMWANPGNLGGTAPVPLVAHRHGGAQDTAADGLPDGWSTPDANRNGSPDLKGRLYTASYTYGNDQEAAHLWYHDHALGVTRLNVYMGLAGHYFIRDANEAYLWLRGMLPAPPYEVPLVIQDRKFTSTGQLHYPSQDLENPAAPAVSHLPEFFGDFILVNGVPWPSHPVEPRPYRLRVLNGSDSRFYDLRFATAAGSAVPFSQVGTDLGLMNAPVALAHLVLAPGERADLVVDFSAFKGQTVRVTNSAPTPYPDGDPVDAATAGQIMTFQVQRPLNPLVPKARLPAYLRPLRPMLPVPSTAGVPVRKLMLLEGSDAFGRLQTLLGTVNPAAGNPASSAYGTFFYSDPVTENVKLGSTEVWEIYNTTVDAHPVHLHLVDFRVVNRQGFSGTVIPKPMGPNGSTTGGYLTQVSLSGSARPAEANEAGRKDTVTAYPGEVTRILVQFARAGEYVWHCHILSHEDHEMMRRFVVAP